MRHAVIFTPALVACSALALSAVADQLAPGNVPAANARVRPAAAPQGQGLGAGMYAARVAADGTLISGVGATGASIISGIDGNYEVDFNRDVSGCFYTASSFDNRAATNVEPRAGNPNGVFLTMSTLGDTSTNPAYTNAEFYLQVYCGS